MVKPGYKQTEIGVIPEDWEVKALKDIVIGSLKYGVNAPAIPYLPPLPNYIRITDISEDGRFLKADRASVECTNPDLYLLKINDICFARTGASTGKTYLYRPEDGSLVYAGFLIKASINPELADPVFVFHLLHTKRYWDWVSVTSMRSGQPGINGVEYSTFRIQYPSLSEQQRIAEALSDMDELISSLEKLIEKKKAIKQGAMQELLTGKRRLPGFSGEWETARFGDLFVICPNNAFTRDQLTIGGKIKNIHYGDILTKYGEYLDGSTANIPTLEKSLTIKKYPDNAFVQSGDVIIADTAEDLTVGKAVEIVNVCGKMLSGQHTFLCRPIIPFAPMYLGYYINSTDFHDQIVPYVTGTKVSSISKASLCSLIVRYPELSEQKAIAEVLTNLDNSIVALQQRFLKAQQIKQGMIQQLLTGETRLM